MAEYSSPVADEQRLNAISSLVWSFIISGTTLSMKILVIGGGGREHALVWKLRQSPRLSQVYCLPGNGGICEEATCMPGDPKSLASLLSVAHQIQPDLTVVGPENFWSNTTGRATGDEQELRQGIHAAPPGPNRTLRRLHFRRRFAQVAGI